MADEKRQGGGNDIRHRICIFLLDVMKLAQDPRCSLKPSFHPDPEEPAAPHKTEVHAGGAAWSSCPAGGKGGNADATGRKNDTKSASHWNISVYARHQMVLKSNPAGNHLPAGPDQSGEGKWAKNDTKSASHGKIRVYARHQMEQRLFGRSAELRQMSLSEVRSAAEYLPDSGGSMRWRMAVGEKRHQIGKCI